MGFRYSQLNVAAAVSVLLLAVTGIFIFLELRLRDQAGVAENLR
jgi:ABC-type sugar transport system permease subunit